MADLAIKFHPQAYAEMMDALDHYLERSADAALAFQQEIANACTAIEQSPESWSLYLRGTRRYLVNRFPYLLIYRVSADAIEVVAVAHGHRKPGYWSDRL